MQKLGCTFCILAFFIIHLTDFSTLSELKYEKARMHNVHTGFFILHLTDICTSSELKDEFIDQQLLPGVSPLSDASTDESWCLATER